MHIALFFVKKEYQGKGVGKILWNAVLKENTSESITVHSSLFAISIYKKLSGFDVFQDSKMIDSSDIKKLSDEKPSGLFIVVTFRDGESLKELEDCLKFLKESNEELMVVLGHAINPDIETRYRITGIF